jgi:hypothetical protein
VRVLSLLLSDPMRVCGTTDQAPVERTSSGEQQDRKNEGSMTRERQESSASTRDRTRSSSLASRSGIDEASHMAGMLSREASTSSLAGMVPNPLSESARLAAPGVQSSADNGSPQGVIVTLPPFDQLLRGGAGRLLAVDTRRAGLTVMGPRAQALRRRRRRRERTAPADLFCIHGAPVTAAIEKVREDQQARHRFASTCRDWFTIAPSPRTPPSFHSASYQPSDESRVITSDLLGWVQRQSIMLSCWRESLVLRTTGANPTDRTEPVEDGAHAATQAASQKQAGLAPSSDRIKLSADFHASYSKHLMQLGFRELKMVDDEQHMQAVASERSVEDGGEPGGAASRGDSDGDGTQHRMFLVKALSLRPDQQTTTTRTAATDGDATSGSKLSPLAVLVELSCLNAGQNTSWPHVCVNTQLVRWQDLSPRDQQLRGDDATSGLYDSFNRCTFADQLALLEVDIGLQAYLHDFVLNRYLRILTGSLQVGYQPEWQLVLSSFLGYFGDETLKGATCRVECSPLALPPQSETLGSDEQNVPPLSSTRLLKYIVQRASEYGVDIPCLDGCTHGSALQTSNASTFYFILPGAGAGQVVARPKAGLSSTHESVLVLVAPAPKPLATSAASRTDIGPTDMSPTDIVPTDIRLFIVRVTPQSVRDLIGMI